MNGFKLYSLLIDLYFLYNGFAVFLGNIAYESEKTTLVL